MVKKILAAAAAFIVLVGIVAAVWARSILATDTVRSAIASQVSRAIGQPVTIGGIGASVFPRVTVDLEQVTIGQPPRIQVDTLHIATNFRALLSRRIEHGTVRLSKARIELPLPAFGSGPATDPEADAAASAAFEIASIDDIELRDVELVSGTRTLRGNIDASIEGQGIVLRSIELAADDTSIAASGRITDMSAPAGELTIKAGSLNLDNLIAFASDFASSAVVAPGPPAGAHQPGRSRAAGSPGKMQIAVTIEAPRATMGGLTIDKLSGRATLGADSLVVDPVSFGLFGGRYEGTLSANLSGKTPAFRWNAALSNIDVAAATAFAGTPGVVTGRLSGKIDLSGSGADAGTAIKTARGTARIDVVDGIVKKLGLVRNVVIATSGREGATMSGGSTDEPFTRLGATLRIASGLASTDDLKFESTNLVLTAAGNVRLDATAVDLAGKVQLSDELSKQAGSDLTRYTAEQGRVTLPATITGPADNLSVKIDVADMAKRAITNRANEEAQKQLKKGLDGLLRRP